MNYMADLIRDCSKARPNSFSEISFPISQDIEAKIKNKNQSLRKKAKSRILERQKSNKPEENKQDNALFPKKETIHYNKIEREQFNYTELYRDPKAQRETLGTGYQLQLDKLDEKDEEMTFQIYLMLKKKKSIFKVEEVRRKLRSKDGNRRMNLKECDCCGNIGKHKCKHIICLKKCERYMRRLEKTDNFQENQQPPEILALAEQLIQHKSLDGPGIAQIKLTVKQNEEEIIMPRIDKIEGEGQKIEREPFYEQPEQNQQPQLPAVRQTERISENESNSQLSKGLKQQEQPNEAIRGEEKQQKPKQDKPIEQKTQKVQIVQKAQKMQVEQNE